MIRTLFLIFLLCVSLFAGVLSHDTCHATVIVSPVGYFNNTMGVYIGNSGTNTMDRAIDQSGLSSGFVSGTTELTAYLGANPTHSSTLTPANFWVSAPAGPGSVDFDLGSTFTISHFVLWQQNYYAGEQINEFTVYTSQVTDFSSLTNVGTFNATIVGSGPAPAEVFDLTPSTGRYVRLSIASNNSGNPYRDIGELAFGVPEPSAYLLASLAAAGLFVAGAFRKIRPRFFLNGSKSP